jgi:hypothetical protein
MANQDNTTATPASEAPRKRRRAPRPPRTCLLAAVAVLALGGSASAQHGDDDWVLLGLDWENGDGMSVRDMGPEADMPNVGLGHAPLFATQRACRAALRHVLQKYANVSHAGGGGGLYLCSRVRDWAVSER